LSPNPHQRASWSCAHIIPTAANDERPRKGSELQDIRLAALILPLSRIQLPCLGQDSGCAMAKPFTVCALCSRNGGRHHFGTVGEIISEWWATSFRNRGRLAPGIRTRLQNGGICGTWRGVVDDSVCDAVGIWAAALLIILTVVLAYSAYKWNDWTNRLS
jgi:hypothetical protein